MRASQAGCRERHSTLAIGLVLLVACSQFHVRSDFDRDADFARLRTYAWLPRDQAEPADQRVLDRYLDTRLRSAVATELGAKGFTPAGPDGPDFLLNYRFATEPAEVMSGRRPMLEGTAWSGADAVHLERYDAGRLYIAVLDAHSRRLVWIGSAEARTLPHISLEKRAKRVDAAVHQILSDFPPKS